MQAKSTAVMWPALRAAMLAVATATCAHAHELIVMALASVLAYVVTRHYLPAVAHKLLSRNLYGIDINKATQAELRAFAQARQRAGNNNNIAATAAGGGDGSSVSVKALQKRAVPESLGILAGGVYLSVVLLLVVVLQTDISLMSGPLITVSVMLLLGFVDDVLDMRWRYKMLLSALGTLPLLLVYEGSTSVLVPPALSSLLLKQQHHGNNNVSGSVVQSSSASSPTLQPFVPWLHNLHVGTIGYYSLSDSGLLICLGPLYLVYLLMLCIFCTNSINILAGVNGVEVGQSMVIACACIVYNVAQLRLEPEMQRQQQLQHDSGGGVAAGSNNGSYAQPQLRALLLLGPFVGVSAALWRVNRYPARVFVGDSYTYFAGTVLAVASITGVYSKTLLLFFTPQLINFIVSLPQLVGVVPCPRHRVPRWDAARDVLCNSHNYTLLNVLLCVLGDMHERTLTRVVMLVQMLACVAGFVVRYCISYFMYARVY